MNLEQKFCLLMVSKNMNGLLEEATISPQDVKKTFFFLKSDIKLKKRRREFQVSSFENWIFHSV